MTTLMIVEAKGNRRRLAGSTTGMDFVGLPSLDGMTHVSCRLPMAVQREALSLERKIERSILWQAADLAHKTSESRPGRGAPLRKALLELEDFFTNNMSHEVIKLEDYSGVAAWARFLVIGHVDCDIERAILERYLPEKEASRLLNFGLQQLRLLTPDKASKRLQGVALKIREALNEGDANLGLKK